MMGCGEEVAFEMSYTVPLMKESTNVGNSVRKNQQTAISVKYIELQTILKLLISTQKPPCLSASVYFNASLPNFLKKK